MRSIKQILIERDGLTESEAENEISDARQDLQDRLNDGEMPFDICAEWFGIEPDYLDELMQI